jgi:DNA-binding response OmpR family regulator
MEAGADDYLTKPLDPDEIEVRLRMAERTLRLQWGRGENARVFGVVKPRESFG